jgi:tetratricopeptide (TPR) repeat protein
VSTNKRLAFLEDLVSNGKADSFALYALALEYDKLSRTEDALGVFTDLRRGDPKYLPMYLMAAKLLNRRGESQAAKEWIAAGVELARSLGDAKTTNELLAELETG